MIKKYKNILFDMDGVLINSMKYHTTAWQHAFKQNNISTTDKKIMELAGMTSIDTIKIICKDNKIKYNDTLITKIKSDKAKELDKIFRVELYDGVYEELIKLKKNNYKLALISGARNYEVQKTVKTHFKNIFDLVISGDDIKLGKPNPEPYQTAINKLNLNKKETVVIEDALSGIQSANSTGIDVLAITTSFPKKELLNATLIFNNHKELFDYLNQN